MKNTLTAGLLALEQKYRQVAPRAVFKKGNEMMTEMKKRTPVEYGTLRDSGQVDKPTWSGNALQMTLGFGGAAEEYAFFVHENLTARHTVGQAKFLESVMKEQELSAQADIIAEIQRGLGL